MIGDCWSMGINHLSLGFEIGFCKQQRIPGNDWRQYLPRMLRSSNNDACQKPSIFVVNIHQLGGCCLPTIHQRMGTTVNDRMGLSEPCTNDQVIYLNNWRTMINMFTYVYHVRRCNDNLISTMGAMLRTSWYLLPSCRIHHDLVPDLNSVGESVEVRSHLPRTWTVLVRATGPPWWKGISYHRILRNCPCWFIVSIYIYIMIQNMQIS